MNPDADADDNDYNYSVDMHDLSTRPPACGASHRQGRADKTGFWPAWRRCCAT